VNSNCAKEVAFAKMLFAFDCPPYEINLFTYSPRSEAAEARGLDKVRRGWKEQKVTEIGKD